MNAASKQARDALDRYLAAPRNDSLRLELRRAADSDLEALDRRMNAVREQLERLQEERAAAARFQAETRKLHNHDDLHAAGAATAMTTLTPAEIALAVERGEMGWEAAQRMCAAEASSNAAVDRLRADGCSIAYVARGFYFLPLLEAFAARGVIAAHDFWRADDYPTMRPIEIQNWVRAAANRSPMPAGAVKNHLAVLSAIKTSGARNRGEFDELGRAAEQATNANRHSHAIGAQLVSSFR